MGLNESQIRRYSRQIVLKEVGGRGQERLAKAKVLVIGAGGLGSPAALYLAGAGVGTIGLVDSDTVDLSNLHRQILHGVADIGHPKTESGRHALARLNPDIRVIAHQQRLTSENALDLFAGYDLIVDGSDNFPARYLVNDAAVISGKPYVYAAVFQYEGQAMTVIPGKGPCYRCLFADPPEPGSVPSCQEAGILGSVAGFFGSLQATEALKYLLGFGEPLIGRLLVADLKTMAVRTINVPRDPDCAVCGPRPTVTRLVDYEEFCGGRRA